MIYYLKCGTPANWFRQTRMERTKIDQHVCGQEEIRNQWRYRIQFANQNESKYGGEKI